jgi:hypothetical protein
MAWHVAPLGEIRNAYNILVGKFEVKRPVGRPRRRWKYRNNIKIDIVEVWLDDCVMVAGF